MASARVTPKERAKLRKTQLATIKKELKLAKKRDWFCEYNEEDDSISIGNKIACVVFDKKYLDRKNYMNGVQIGYGRLIEAMDWSLLTMDVMGHA